MKFQFFILMATSFFIACSGVKETVTFGPTQERFNVITSLEKFPFSEPSENLPKIKLVKNNDDLLVKSDQEYVKAKNGVKGFFKNHFLGDILPKIDKTNVGIATRPSTDTLNVYEDIIYARWGNRGMVLDLYSPKKQREPLPAVLLIHGGGWKEGSHKTYRPAAIKLAKRGFATITVEYRLSGEAAFPAAIYDIKAATRWARANAKKYNIDPKRIGICGGSAGGHLAMLSAVTYKDHRFEGESNFLEQSSQLQAAASMYGPMSWCFETWLGKNSKVEKKEMYPDTHIRAGGYLPPVLFLNEFCIKKKRPYLAGWGIDTHYWITGYRETYSDFQHLEAPHGFMLVDPFLDTAIDRLSEFFKKQM